MIPNRPLSEVWRDAAEKWVDAESAASALEDTKSAVFSQMVLRNPQKSMALSEVTVRASDEWREHLSKIGKARTAANKAKIQMEFQRLRFMENQSREATERTEARL